MRAFGVVIFLALLSTVAYVGFHEIDSHEPDRSEYWKERIHVLGAEAAYAELTCSFQDQPDLAGHEEGHAFGAALAMELGMSGISICDDQFHYACLHEFTGRMLQQRGVSVIPKLKEYCEKIAKPTSLCEHGVGHGLLAYQGYSRSDAQKSIDVCNKSMGDTDAAHKCISGVFMEYLDRTILGPDNAFMVDFDQPLAPCADFSGSDLVQCSRELPRVWRKAMAPDITAAPEIVSALGALCAETREPEAMVSCVRGIGYETYRLMKGDTAKARVLCSQLIDKDSIETCIEGVAYLDTFDNKERVRCEQPTNP